MSVRAAAGIHLDRGVSFPPLPFEGAPAPSDGDCSSRCGFAPAQTLPEIAMPGLHGEAQGTRMGQALSYLPRQPAAGQFGKLPTRFSVE